MKKLLSNLSPQLSSKLNKKRVLKDELKFVNVLLDNLEHADDVHAVCKRAELGVYHSHMLHTIANLNMLSKQRFKEVLFFGSLAFFSVYAYKIDPYFDYAGVLKTGSYFFGGFSALSALAHTLINTDIRKMKNEIRYLISISLTPIFPEL